jgi:hypothetical protein
MRRRKKEKKDGNFEHEIRLGNGREEKDNRKKRERRQNIKLAHLKVNPVKINI